MIRKIVLTGMIAGMFQGLLQAQDQGKTSDTVIVNLTNTSRIIFTVHDRSDLDVLSHYDFQQIFDDIITKLRESDSTSVMEESSVEARETEEEEVWSLKENEDDPAEEEMEEEEDDHYDDEEWSWEGKRWGKTWQSFNFDLGTNNYLSDGKFPDADGATYAVRPWGSWYLAINSTQRTRFGRNFFLEWGLGMNWYNFKFQKDNVVIVQDDNGAQFVEDGRDASFKKSKLTVSYINASLVPVFDFSDIGRKPRVWDGHHDSFRIGVGPYVGYRVGSHSKLVYKEDSGREKDKERDNFYLENLRYGLRMQLGFRGTDLFFNYDLNELFAANRGPSLNAFSFGVIF